MDYKRGYELFRQREILKQQLALLESEIMSFEKTYKELNNDSKETDKS